jgi:hypothetical protein
MAGRAAEDFTSWYRTRQVGTARNVLNNDFRHPVLVAREAATIDLLTEGRLQLGLGAGYVQSEYEQAGLDFDGGWHQGRAAGWRVMPRPVSNRGSSPVPDDDRLAPIKLMWPPTAKAFSDIAIVPGPPISTIQPTPRPSVSSRTLASQSGVSI